MSVDATQNIARLKELVKNAELRAALSLLDAVISYSETSPEEIGSTLGTLLLDLYNDFYVEGVEHLYDAIPERVEGTIAQEMINLLRSPVEETRQWRKTIDSLDNERLVRDLRSAIRQKEYEQGSTLTEQLLLKSPEPEERMGSARLLGSALGSLINDQEKVKEFLELFQKKSSLFTPEDLSLLKEEMEKRTIALYRSQTELSEREWSRGLVNATVEFKQYFPDRNDLTEINQEDRQRALLLLRSLLRPAMEKRGRARWFSVIELISELCPHPLSVTGQLAGAEPRLVSGLGPKAQRLIPDAFASVGTSNHLLHAFTSFLQQPIPQRYLKLSIEILGRLKSPLAAQFLTTLLKEKRAANLRTQLAEALGYSQHPVATPLLLEQLKKALKGPVLDPPKRRWAQHLLTSLAAIFHNPSLNQKQYQEILSLIQRSIPKDEFQMQAFAGCKLFTPVRDDISDEYLQWAIQALVHSLALKSSQPIIPIDQQNLTPLAHRQPIADCLVHIGSHNIDVLIEELSSQEIPFGGALWAVAEVLEKLGSPKALPLLEKMLLIAMAERVEEHTPGQEPEMYWEPAENRMKPLDPDRITSSIVYAIRELNTPEAERILAETLQRVQSGDLPAPGPLTARFIMDGLTALARQHGRGSAFAAPQERVERADPMANYDKSRLHSMLKGSGLFKSREHKRLERLAALKELARRGAFDLLPEVVELVDSDSAELRSAVREFIIRVFQKVDKQKRAYIAQELLETLKSKKMRVRDEIAKVILELDPSGDFFYSRLQKFVRMDPHLVGSAQVELILRTYHAREKGDEETPEEPDEAIPGLKTTRPTRTPEFVSRVELKRQYLEARRRWIQEGKKGPPPPKPEELDES